MSLPLLLHRRSLYSFRNPPLLPQIPLLLRRRLSALPSEHTPPPTNPSDPRSNLSARLSFVFDQIDAIDQRPQQQQKDQALQLIRQWRQSRNQQQKPQQDHHQEESTVKEEEVEERRTTTKKKKVEVVHPWPEWIELMERLGQQNYFMDFHQRRVADEEERLAESVGIDLSREVDAVEEEVGFDFTRDWTTVRNACMNFGKDRFDILR